MSPLSKITNPENTSQFKLVKNLNSKRVNNLLIHNTIAVTSYNRLLTFRDICKKFELIRDLSKILTNKNYNVDLASLLGKTLKYDFAKEMIFSLKSQGSKPTRETTLLNSFKSPAIMALGNSKTRFLSFDPVKLCDRLKLILQRKHGGNNCDKNNEEVVAIVQKLLEYK